SANPLAQALVITNRPLWHRRKMPPPPEPGRYCGVPPQHCARCAKCGRDRRHGVAPPRRLAGRRHPRQRGEMMRVVLAQPRGFCAGVERAIEIVERALEKYGPPIYV